MLDSAATTSAILFNIADSIGAEIYQTPCVLSTFNSREESLRDFTNFTVQPIDGTFDIDVENALVGSILTTERDRPPKNHDISHLSYLKDVRFHELDDPTVGIILGARFAWTWIGGEIRVNSRHDPVCLLTKFGWTILGPQLEKHDNEPVFEAEVCLLDTQESSLSDEIRYMYRHDFIMNKDEVAPHEMIHPSQKDEYSLKQMRESITFDEDLGHYRVALPWREGRSQAAKIFAEVDSYANAYNRLMKEKNKLKKDPARKEGVFKQIRETLDLGHARKVTTKEVTDGTPVWYMPIHVVTRPDKPGKFRICQDAASVTDSTNLNRHLCTGPNLLNSLLGVLLRFRRRKIALSADIKGFFHMIHVEEKDIPAFRFLFFEDETMNKVVELESTVHIFGASSSPPVANFTLKHHGEQMRAKYGDEVCEETKNQYYMDDYMTSFDDIAHARMMKKKMTDAMAEGGFELTKWSSSHPEVLTDQPSSLPTSLPNSQVPIDNAVLNEAATIGDKSIDIEENSTNRAFQTDALMAEENQPLKNPEVSQTDSKVLGLGYSHVSDSLFVRVTDKWDQVVKTKRQMLKLVASVYDPVGLVQPFTLKGRMFLQTANELKCDWDDELPQDLLKKFNEWRGTMPLLKSLRIPRWTSSDEFIGAKTDLIMFSDSSHEAYGAIAYIRRWFEGSPTAHVAQIYARGHVVPLNMHIKRLENQDEHNDSIPRLELNAARLAALMRDLLSREAGEKFDRVIMFSDSSTVLNWLSDFDKKFRTFENFRIKKIRLLTDIAEWRYVPSADNPADIVSHGLNADSPLWPFYFSGPPWLSQSEDEWPPPRPIPASSPAKKDLAIVADVAPIRLVALNATSALPQWKPSSPKFADWRLEAAERVDGWSRKIERLVLFKRVYEAFLTYLKRKKAKTTFSDIKINFKLSLSDYRRGEKELIRAIQSKHFETEILKLISLGVFSPNARTELRSKSSKLTTKNPFLDNDLIIRTCGRLGPSETMSFDSKYPIILPNKDENVKSLIRLYHHRLAHTEINHTYHMLREKYYILGGRTTVNEVLRYCVTCQKKDKAARPQKEGELPKDRIELIKPYRASGIDVFGPFGVKHGGRATHKRWVLLITCMATRAIALLPLKDMSTPTLINALIKFHNNFPGLEVIYSDNGSNFKGASREIKEAVDEWNKEQIDKEFRIQGIEWIWGPPNCPHWGGTWERLVKSAKRHLKFLLEKDNLPLDTFETALTQVAAILNSRPLTYASTDINDMRALSPANFLYPYAITPSSTTILPSQPADGDRLRSAWRDVRRIADEFVKRWRKEYVTTLISRTKWKTTAKNAYVGQLVVMVDDQTPRDFWTIARIDDVLSDDINHARRFRVTTANGKTYDRHITKIIPLELEAEEMERSEKNEK